MGKNLSRFKEDLKKLVQKGLKLYFALYKELPDEERNQEMDEIAKKIDIDFRDEYENWYSESWTVIKQILPNRLDDFVGYYKCEKRKSIDYETYTISDFLIGLVVTHAGEEIVNPLEAALTKFKQQRKILESIKPRFESSLFDIQQLVRADLFDSELDGAGELVKSGFLRAAGAIAGVVLEKHLGHVCINHNISIKKKNPNISYFNDKLKDGEVIDIPVWRFIQRLADLRNLCCHKKQREPKEEELQELIGGVDKVTKTLF